MLFPRSLTTFLILVLFSAHSLLTEAVTPLQPLIDATPPGGLLQLGAGDYSGPVVIRNALLLDGASKARLLGGGRGTVLSVMAKVVTVRGLVIDDSRDTHDGIDTGLLVTGDDNSIEGNTMVDVRFGIHIKTCSRNHITDNHIVGRHLSMALRGDAVRLWNSRHNRIENNQFEHSRDLTLANSPDNHILNNRFNDGRYGTHVVFSPRLVVKGNRIENTQTGIVVLYSPGLVVRGNHVAHALTGGGGGMVFKESDGCWCRTTRFCTARCA